MSTYDFLTPVERAKHEAFNKMTPSELLRIGLYDLGIAEETPGVEIRMGSWMRTYNGECHVCMAGAILRETFQFDVPTFEGLGYVNQRKLLLQWPTTLDLLRQGKIAQVFARDEIEMPEGMVGFFAIPAYVFGPAKFRFHIGIMIEYLEEFEC